VTRDVVPLPDATRTWFAISLQTFGGPAGQIAVMHRHLVDDKRWIGEQRFLHALSYCMLLPGPEAQQLATYIGWLLNGWRGGLVAGVLFVVPGVAVMMALAAIYVGYGETTAITGLFAGLAPAVVAIVIQAVIRVGRRALNHAALVAIAVTSFVALLAFHVPFPVVVLAAGVLGFALRIPTRPHAQTAGPAPLIPDDALHHEPPSPGRQLRILLPGLALWVLPVAVVSLWLGSDSVLVDQGLFFGGTALVSFGGAYAVLAFVAQHAVHTYHWLSASEMVRGLALAESTPGPLILVLQFVAFVGAYHSPGPLDPWVAGVVGALLTVWVTFVPCFLFIVLGAPYVERLRDNRALSAALTGITAAVVGVIANLAVFFADHTLVDLQAWLLCGLALALLYLAKWSPLRVLGICALLGLGLQLVG
jgi:chromate transporter